MNDGPHCVVTRVHTSHSIFRPLESMEVNAIQFYIDWFRGTISRVIQWWETNNVGQTDALVG